MTAPTSNDPLAFFSAGPFPLEDIAKVGFEFLTVEDAGRFSQVCKAWNAAMQSTGIWSTLFDVEKIPRVEEGALTVQEDLRFMFPRTYSARKMACLGKFVGLVPMISAKPFEMFKTAMDPYEPNKKFSETFSFIVEPTEIYRDYNEALLEALIANGDFESQAPENKNPQENGLRIPYSLKNLKILAEHPLAKKGEGPVFSSFDPEALTQCSRIAKTVKVTVMRKEVPEQSRNLTYSGQIECAKEKGHVLVPLCTRGYFDVVEILNKNTCADSREPRLTYSRTSDEIKIGNDKYPLAIGCFAPGIGVDVYNSYDDAYSNRGAAAEVLQPLDIGRSV